MTTTIALVTGGNNGIVQAVVRRIAGLDWAVILATRAARLGAAAAAELSAESVQLDVTDDDPVEHAAREIEARHGRLDVLVNNRRYRRRLRRFESKVDLLNYPASKAASNMICTIASMSLGKLRTRP